MGLLTPVAIKLGSVPWMPRALPMIVRADLAVQTVTRGRYGLPDLGGLPNLLLTVPGRKTGQPRSTPLLCAPSGGKFFIAGSNWGQAKDPMWVRNLEAALSGQLRYRGRTQPFTARRLAGAERAAAWEELNRLWPNYRLYEKRTNRIIKVFELTPGE